MDLSEMYGEACQPTIHDWRKEMNKHIAYTFCPQFYYVKLHADYVRATASTSYIIRIKPVRGKISNYE